MDNSQVIVSCADDSLNCDMKNVICYIPTVTFCPTFDFYTLLNSLIFDKKFKSGRNTQLFGVSPYKYGKVEHSPCCITSNRFVCEMFDFINTNFPFLSVNSCLINYYPDMSCFIPDHCDDENHIAQGSFIVTISLGSTRKMLFKDMLSKNLLCSVTLTNGQVLIFSKLSQSFFTHGVLASVAGHTDYSDFSPRISATFRQIT